MKNKKVLFIDTVHLILREKLEEFGMYCEDASEWKESKILEEIINYNGVVIRSRFKIEKKFLDKAINLEFIARAGAGMENIDEKYATEKGIQCINAPEGNRNAVAEHALGMLLSLLNNLTRSAAEVKDGVWRREENRGIELDGKTIGIIGFGNTGQAFVKKLAGFDINILVNDPYVKVDSNIFPKIRQTQLNEIFLNCDIVSFHIPLTDETLYLANEKFFSSFSKPVFVINTSRGKILKTDDLIKALESGKIKGAALDVLEFENVSFENLSKTDLPESFSKLTSFENVLLSPHIAGWTFESHQKISEILAKKIIEFYKTEY